MNYFITGLPRSRTAWCANFLTYDGRMCHHDYMGEHASVEEMKRSLDEGDGVADPFLLMNWEVVIKAMPDAKWVVIHREFHTALQSAFETMPEVGGKGWNHAEAFMRGLWVSKDELCAADVDLIELNFENFDAVKLWDFCRPDAPVDENRLAMLEGMRVETRFNNELVTQENVVSLMKEVNEARMH